MRGEGHPRRLVFLAAGTALGMATVAAAQDNLGGKILRLTLGQSLQYSDNIDLVANPGDGILRSSTRLGLSYSDVTRTQAFRFGTAGSYEIDSDDQVELSDPFAQLSYALTGANSRLNFSADYRRSNLDDAFSNQALIPTDSEEPDLDDEDVVEGDTPVSVVALIENGERINSNYTIGFETGLQSSIGLRADLTSSSRRYTGTTDPDLFETTDNRINLRTTFRIDPQITARLTARGRRYSAEDIDQTERTETSLGAGVAFDVSPTLRLDLSLSQQRTEIERVTGTTITDGLTYGASLTRLLPNGTLGVDFDSSETLNGRRNTLRVNRAMALRREGTLSYGIGVNKTGGLSPEPLFTLAYVQPLKLGRFGIELNQEARTDEDDDNAVILTRLSANYAAPLSPTVNWSVSAGLSDVSTQTDTGEDRRRIDLRSDLRGQINAVSSWSAGITLSDTQTSSATAREEQRRYGLQLAYRREVAREWDMVARYQHTSILDSTAADRRSNAVSLGLEKTFSFRP